MALKWLGVGYLLGGGRTPKTALIAAYLAAHVDVRAGTCWGSTQSSVLRRHKHFGSLSSGEEELAK